MLRYSIYGVVSFELRLKIDFFVFCDMVGFLIAGHI